MQALLNVNDTEARTADETKQAEPQQTYIAAPDVPSAFQEAVQRVEIRIPRRLQAIPGIAETIRTEVVQAFGAYARISVNETTTKFTADEKIKLLNFLAYFTSQDDRSRIFSLLAKR